MPKNRLKHYFAKSEEHPLEQLVKEVEWNADGTLAVRGKMAENVAKMASELGISHEDAANLALGTGLPLALLESVRMSAKLRNTITDAIKKATSGAFKIGRQNGQ